MAFPWAQWNTGYGPPLDPRYGSRSRSHSRGRPINANVDDSAREVDRLAREIRKLNDNQEREREEKRLKDLMAGLRRDKSRSSSRSRSRSRRRRRSRSPSIGELQRDLERLQHEHREMEEKAHKKDHDKEIIEKWELQQAEKKRKEDEAYKAWEAARKAKEIADKEKAKEERRRVEEEIAAEKAKAEKEKKEEEKKVEEGVRQYFRDKGYNEFQIDRELEFAKKKKEGVRAPAVTNTTTTIIQQPPQQPGLGMSLGQPVQGFFQVHKSVLSRTVLNHYNIRWKLTADGDHYLLFQDMDKAFLDVLHEESQKHWNKKNVKLIEQKKEHHHHHHHHNEKYKGFFVVEKKKSRSRSRG